MNRFISKKILIGTGVVAVLLIVLISNIWRRYQQTPGQMQTIPVATVTLAPKLFNSVSTAPTIQTSQGVGVNIETDPVKVSIAEIEKLTDYLPYTDTISLETGEQATLIIPRVSSNAHRWLLTVNVNEVDFEIPASDPAYKTNKALFRKAAATAYAWVKSHGAAPEKIMFLWGDTRIMQETAQRWLQED